MMVRDERAIARGQQCRDLLMIGTTSEASYTPHKITFNTPILLSSLRHSGFKPTGGEFKGRVVTVAGENRYDGVVRTAGRVHSSENTRHKKSSHLRIQYP